jgi:xanthine/CO dehydrogenase XdhC/CoxF family maturation factor
MLVQQIEAALQAGQHAEREDVDLENADGVEIVLVPFDAGALLHRRVLDRHHLVEPAAGDDEAAHMLGEVARKADQLARQRQHPGELGV